MDRFWWHSVIVLHKFVMVMIKTFVFNSFYQCPIALTFTFFLMGAQAYAKPYASELLDRLQTAAYSAHFIYLFFGLLFATEKGGNDLNDLLTNLFFAVFGIMFAMCLYMVVNDLKRYTRLQAVLSVNGEYKLAINPKQWASTPLSKWLRFITDDPNNQQSDETPKRRMNW